MGEGAKFVLLSREGVNRGGRGYAQVQIGSTNFSSVFSFEAGKKHFFKSVSQHSCFAYEGGETRGWVGGASWRGGIHAIRLPNLNFYTHFLQSLLST